MTRLPRAAAAALALALAAPAAFAGSALQTATQFMGALQARDVDAAAALLTDDVATVLMFHESGDTAPGALRRFDGKPATLAYFGGAAERLPRVAFVEVEVTEGTDGETVFVEARGDMDLVDGRPYANLYVWRLKVEDGRVAHIREYFNPVTAAQAFGRPTDG